MTKVTLLAGGVGGAKMAEGFAALDDVDLTIIGNVADDEEFHGLWVSPDIDTMLYTLSGRINRAQGWGLADEGRRGLDMLTDLGADTWMFLGDRDFGLHIYRTERLRRGDRPTEITADIAKSFGITSRLILPTDDRVQTRVRTEAGWLSFQEYFVRERCAPEVLELTYEGLEDARMTAEASSALAEADLIVIAPSNPLVSIGPILGTAGLRDALKTASAPVVAVSPLIAGKVVKGPADRMLAGLGHRADAVGVAALYENLADHLLIDNSDTALAGEISAKGIAPHATDILMPDLAGRARLAGEIMSLFQELEKDCAA
ncbi:LPPG:FO 2-phospho-L-lactate transferase [Cognatishimia activa]|uniref:LPPG:FO 2-phospho-L-lactate transferase n=1 Tax=Cognatishimia activa TaxID=1715691 RepID=A0A0P1IV05_9RHOB|nr:2-phospho-L-lactate transferase [Cognatishimia activa]CUK27443.1 LPPG:FO 2-phospho-L-lactate transferase [Cognatishimia activa]